jgi:predicted acylesterase/phospholipase RssA
MAKKQLCISIAGGGALGIGPLAFMCRLEQDLGKKLCDLTSAFAGTSTGSIIAACLAEGYSAHDIFELYKNNLKKIFTKYSWYKRLKPSCPTYDNSNLKKLLQSNLKGKCSDWKKPIFIPTTCMNGKSVEKVWDLGDKDVDKAFAVLTSCAAPTYFDVIEKDGLSYMDGGCWANECSDILLAGQFKQGHKDIKILNFSTGMETPNTEHGNQTLLGWAEYMLSDWIARSSKSPQYECEAILGAENVFNACPTYKKKLKMDNVSDENINLIMGIWDKYYETVRINILDFIKNV